MAGQSLGPDAPEVPRTPDVPVFVDSSGGRRRRWRRLGLAMGVAGGGYALVLAASVIGGHSDAPWVLIPGKGDDRSGSVRVVPQPGEDSDTGIPAADAEASPGVQASPGTSPPATGASGARSSAGSDEASPSAGESSGANAKATPLGESGAGKGKGAGGSKGKPNVPPAPATSPAPSTGGGGSTPTENPSEPAPEPTPTTEAENGDGLLGGIIDQLGGGSPAAGAA